MMDEFGGLPSKQTFRAHAGEEEDQDNQPRAGWLDPGLSLLQERSENMLPMVLVSAPISAIATIGLVVLLDLSLLWGVPIYGVLGALLTLALVALVAAASEDDA